MRDINKAMMSGLVLANTPKMIVENKYRKTVQKVQKVQKIQKIQEGSIGQVVHRTSGINNKKKKLTKRGRVNDAVDVGRYDGQRRLEQMVATMFFQVDQHVQTVHRVAQRQQRFLAHGFTQQTHARHVVTVTGMNAEQQPLQLHQPCFALRSPALGCLKISKIEKSVSIDHTHNCSQTCNKNKKRPVRIHSTVKVIQA